jgi:hypothetical protein
VQQIDRGCLCLALVLSCHVALPCAMRRPVPVYARSWLLCHRKYCGSGRTAWCRSPEGAHSFLFDVRCSVVAAQRLLLLLPLGHSHSTLSGSCRDPKAPAVCCPPRAGSPSVDTAPCTVATNTTSTSSHDALRASRTCYTNFTPDLHSFRVSVVGCWLLAEGLAARTSVWQWQQGGPQMSGHLACSACEAASAAVKPQASGGSHG